MKYWERDGINFISFQLLLCIDLKSNHNSSHQTWESYFNIQKLSLLRFHKTFTRWIAASLEYILTTLRRLLSNKRTLIEIWGLKIHLESEQHCCAGCCCWSVFWSRRDKGMELKSHFSKANQKHSTTERHCCWWIFPPPRFTACKQFSEWDFVNKEKGEVHAALSAGERFVKSR